MAITITSTSTVRLNVGGTDIGPDGLVVKFTVTGTNSLVLKKNTAPPGSAPSYTDVPYLNALLVAQVAGTAITASGLAYVSAADAALDLFATNTFTSGEVVVFTSPANVGGPDGAIPFGDVTGGTAGSNTGSTEAYAVPGAFDAAGALSGATVASDADVTGTVGTFSTSVGLGVAGAATSAVRFRKAVSAIADNTATTVLTITVPNDVECAVVRVTALGVLGAGGVIGAGEAMASNTYDISVVRTAGVAAVAGISTAYGARTGNVAGASTCTAALTVAAVAGAVGAVNTFPVQITIVRSASSSTNHTCALVCEVLNQNAAGVTVA